MAENTDLAFHTSKELVKELMRRRTFVGLVIFSENCVGGKAPPLGPTTFQIYCNNIAPQQASEMLTHVSDLLRDGEPGEEWKSGREDQD